MNADACFPNACKAKIAPPADVLCSLDRQPHPPGRIEPRCKKRRAKQYGLMNKPRDELRKLLKNKRKTE